MISRSSLKLGHWGQILGSWTKSPLDDYSFQDKQSHCSVKCRSHDLHFLLHKSWCDTEADSQALDSMDELHTWDIGTISDQD